MKKLEKRLFMVAITKYDVNYYKYYTNQDIDLLSITAYQSQYINRKNTTDIILIGPTHVNKNVIDLDSLNILSEKISTSINSKTTYKFKYIK